VLCLGLIFLLAGCAPDATDTYGRTIIRIAYLPITHSAAVMVLPEVTRDDERFAVELVRFTAWPEVVEALRSGRVDGASMLLEVAFRASETNDALVSISLSHRDGNVIVVDNTIESYHDLIGRTIAIPHTLSPHNTLLRMVLEREGIDIDDVNIIEISPAEMPFTMAARAISAFVVAEPWGSLAEVRGIGRILETSNEIIPCSVCCLLVFNSNLLMEHEGLLDWLLCQFELAAAYAHAMDDVVFDAFRRSARFEREIIAQSLEITNFENLIFTREDFDEITNAILRFDIMSRVPNFDDFVINHEVRGCCHENP